MKRAFPFSELRRRGSAPAFPSVLRHAIRRHLWISGLLQIPRCLIMIAAIASHADVIHWTNTSGGNWSVAANWNPNQVPSTNDTALITNAGSYTVTLNVDPTVAGLLLGGSSGPQTLAVAGRTLTLNGTSLVVRWLAAGTIMWLARLTGCRAR
jgi:hypothetical protein